MRTSITLLLLVAPLLAQHPQILLDSATLAKMRSKVLARDADWRTVHSLCDQYVKSIVYVPSLMSDGASGEVYSGNSGSSKGDCTTGIGNDCQYQGGQYFNATRTLGACYLALAPTDITQARKYSKKAKEIIGALTGAPMTVQKGGGPQYAIANRALAGQPYGTFYWTQPGTGIAAGDRVTIAGALGCTNLNGTWTVASANTATITFEGLPAANANCENRNWYYARDSGFGARYYGRALSLLYDWFNPELTSAESAALTSTMASYSDSYFRLGYGRGHPENNYAAAWSNFAMYCYAAWLNDNPALSSSCQAQWNASALAPDGQRDYFNRWMYGGGYGEGLAAYGYGAIRNLAEVVMTAWSLGQDWRNAPQNWNYIEDQAKYFLMASKPDRVSMDEQEYVYFNAAPNHDNPTLLDPPLLYMLGWGLQALNSPYAPYFHSLIQNFEANSGALAAPLDRFLYYDAAAPVADQTSLPKSYLAWGGNFATARSDWSSGAVVLQFQGGPTTGSGGNGKTQFESGAVAIWNGSQPFVVFGTGEASRSYDILKNPVPDQLLGERATYANHKVSVFAADRPGANFTRIQAYGVDPVRPPGVVPTVTSFPSKIDRSEDAGSYAYYRGVGLEANFSPSLVDGNVHNAGWSRQVLFLRPKIVVVYDQTSVKLADDDRALFWVFGRDLAQAADPAPGTHRFQASRHSGSTFKGALTTVLPLNSNVSIVNHGVISISGTGTSSIAVSGAPLNFLYRVEQRPTAMDHTDDTWLNVLDAAASAGDVEGLTPLTATNADLLQLSASGVVGFVKGQSPVLPIKYSFTGFPRHFIVGFAPNAPYHVAIGADSTITISAATGSGDLVASPAGVLSYDSQAIRLPRPATAEPIHRH